MSAIRPALGRLYARQAFRCVTKFDNPDVALCCYHARDSETMVGGIGMETTYEAHRPSSYSALRGNAYAGRSRRRCRSSDRNSHRNRTSSRVVAMTHRGPLAGGPSNLGDVRSCGGFRTPAPESVAPSSWGRRPKTFTVADLRRSNGEAVQSRLPRRTQEIAVHKKAPC